MRIPTMIKKLIKPNGQMTCKQLADKLKVTERSIYYWKIDKAIPDYYTGKKLEKLVRANDKGLL